MCSPQSLFTRISPSFFTTLFCSVLSSLFIPLYKFALKKMRTSIILMEMYLHFLLKIYFINWLCFVEPQLFYTCPYFFLSGFSENECKESINRTKIIISSLSMKFILLSPSMFSVGRKRDHRGNVWGLIYHCVQVLTHRTGSAVMLSLIYSEILKMLRIWGLIDFDVEISFPLDLYSLPRGYQKQKSKDSDQPHIITVQMLLEEVTSMILLMYAWCGLSRWSWRC